MAEWKLDKWWKKLFYGVGWLGVVMGGIVMWIILLVTFLCRDKELNEKKGFLIHGHQKFVYVIGIIDTFAFAGGMLGFLIASSF